MTQDRIFSVLRNLLTIAGGYLLGKSFFGTTVDANTWEAVVGAILSIVGTVWAIVDKTVTVEKIQGTVRHIISIIGGILVASGKLSAEALATWTGIILALLPLLQGQLSRIKVQQLKQGVISEAQLKS